MTEKDPTDLNHHPLLPQTSRKKDPKDLKRHPLLPPSTRNALFYTFVGITYPDNIPPPYHPPKKKPPITDFLFEWKPVNLLKQSIYRYHRLWTETFNEIEHGFNNEVYETSYVDGYCWSPMEKRRFFAALDKCGPHDPAGIQQRIGPSKTVYQVGLYINLLQAAAEKYPISDDNDHNNEQLFAHEMSPEWISFEERMAYHLSVLLDNEAVALDFYHRAVEKAPPPSHVTTTQQEMAREVYMAYQIINTLPLYEWASMNPVDGIAPPIMTLETQVVFYRLLRNFVAKVMTGVILNHKRRRRQVKLDLMTDDLDIGESEIDTALRDYYDDDIDMDMDVDMDIKQDLVDIDSDDLDDDGEGLGFVVGENSDMDTDTDTDAESDSGSENRDSDDSDDDSDNDDRSDTSAGGDSDEIDQHQIDENFNIGLQQVDRFYEQGLYQHIAS